MANQLPVNLMVFVHTATLNNGKFHSLFLCVIFFTLTVLDIPLENQNKRLILLIYKLQENEKIVIYLLIYTRLYIP